MHRTDDDLRSTADPGAPRSTGEPTGPTTAPGSATAAGSTTTARSAANGPVQATARRRPAKTAAAETTEPAGTTAAAGRTSDAAGSGNAAGTRPKPTRATQTPPAAEQPAAVVAEATGTAGTPDATDAPAQVRRLRKAPAPQQPAATVLPPAYGGDGEARSAAERDVADAADRDELSGATTDAGTVPDLPADTYEADVRAAIDGPSARPAPTPEAGLPEPDAVDRYDEPTDDILGGRAAPTPVTEPTAAPAPAVAETGRSTGTGTLRAADAGQDDALPEDAGPEDARQEEPDPERADHDRGDVAGGVPDVMVLPENPRERPTVVLPRGPVPGQSQRHDAAPATPGGRPAEPSGDVPADRRTFQQVRVGRGRADPARLQAIEESPFWSTAEDGTRDGAGPESDTRQAQIAGRIGVPPSRRDRPRAPRTPLVGLVALLVVAYAATFFAWVSAEPIWLAVGHSRTGTATVTGCSGSGITQRCQGVFTDGTQTSPKVALLGVDAAERRTGATVPARMVHADARRAFVGASGPMLHLRWTIGVLLVLLCGLAIAGATGARRLESARARRRAVLLSIAGPLALLAGFLAASY
jgi:hypothetical protein